MFLWSIWLMTNLRFVFRLGLFNLYIIGMDKLYTWIYWQGKIVLNLASYCGPYLLVSLFIQQEGRGWGVSFFKPTAVQENLVQHPSGLILVILVIYFHFNLPSFDREGRGIGLFIILVPKLYSNVFLFVG